MVNSKMLKNIEKLTFDDFKKLIKNFLDDSNPPKISTFKAILPAVNGVLSKENSDIRPVDKDGRSGGLIDLRKYKNVIVLPDLHARRVFFRKVLCFKKEDKLPVLELLENDQIALLCLGDGVHAEAQHYERWMEAYNEFEGDYVSSFFMDQEIADSFNLMLAIMCLKIRYPDNFHFLKGNHENIFNESGNGNYSFAKFCLEGMMVIRYFRKKYDAAVLDLYSQFEKNLPLFVVGKNFLASHAEPEFFFNEEEIINYRDDGGLVEALTWTPNNTSEHGTVNKLLRYFIPENYDNALYFGGHRPINRLYKRVKFGRYIQIHNPTKEIVLFLDQDTKIILRTSVIDLSKS